MSVFCKLEVVLTDLGEFSNVPDAAVNAKAYDGVAIECSKITFKPGVCVYVCVCVCVCRSVRNMSVTERSLCLSILVVDIPFYSH